MDKIKLKPYSQAIFFAMLIAAFAFSASTPPPAMNDPYTGLYYVHGSKIVKSGSLMDTTHIASVVAVKLMQEKTDTLHFFGLPGADEGEIKLYFGRSQIGDKAGEIQVYDESNFAKVFGIQSGNSFEIRFNNAGNFYEGTGSIINGEIELQGLYTFRTLSVEYNLTGEKIAISN